MTVQSQADVRHRTTEHVNLFVIFISNKINFPTQFFGTGQVSAKTYIGADKSNCLALLDGKRAHISRMARGWHASTYILPEPNGCSITPNSSTNVHTFAGGELHENTQSDKMCLCPANEGAWRLETTHSDVPAVEQTMGNM